ncbi:hypothetical protein ACJ41O_001477 [Fusarium nematophilum]
MKYPISLISMIGLSMAAPSAEVPQAQDVAEAAETDKGFNVDLSALAAFASEGEDGKLEARGKCGSLETCVGRRCVRLECMPISQYTTTCITYKYGPC